MKYFNSTLTHQEHKDTAIMKKATVERMQKLSQTIAHIKRDKYDREPLSIKEIGEAVSGKQTQLHYLEKYGIDGTIVMTEYVLADKKILELEKEKKSFRDEHENADEIEKLRTYKHELSVRFQELMAQAAKQEKYEARMKKEADAIATLKPIHDSLEKAIKEIKANKDTVHFAVSENISPTPYDRLMIDIISNAEYQAV